MTPTETVAVTLPVLGAYNVSNALLAIEIARTLDVPLSDIVSALANFELTKNRTQWVKGQNGVAILNDAYNASPIAMKSVIKSFVSVEAAGRRVLVLGDIRELGEHSKRIARQHLKKSFLQAKSHLCTCMAKKWKHSMMR